MNRLFCILGVLSFCSCAIQATRAADTNPPRLTIELRDGSRVVGTGVEKYLRFHSALLGDLKLEVKDIRSVESVSTNATKLVMASGDNLAVSSADSEIAVKTSFGNVKLAVDSIRKITVSATGRFTARRPGLVALWSGENNAGDSAGDHHGTLAGNATFADGKVGQAFSLDGAGSFVKIPQSASLNVANQLTIAFWMKAAADNQMNNYQGLVTSDFYAVEISNGFGGRMGVNFGISTTANQPGILLNQPMQWSGMQSRITSVGDYAHISDANGGGAPVTAGQWHHIAATCYGAKLQLYIDGRKWGNPVPKTGVIAPMLADSFMAIGSEDGRTACPDCVASRYFKGLIDEVAIYNRALSATEIQAICTEENNGEPLPPPTASPGMIRHFGSASGF